MKTLPTTSLRNVVLLGHSGAGKTALADALVYLAGHGGRHGRTVEGTSVFDYDPDEIARGNSIQAAVGFAEWNEHRVNLIDTPGLPDFFGDVAGATRVADAALLVVSAVEGPGVQLEKGWQKAQEHGLAGLAWVSKMDGERADFGSAVNSLREQLQLNAVPFQLPIGAAGSFSGVIDLLAGKAYGQDAQGKAVEIPVPTELADEAEAAKEKLVEAAAEGTEALMEKYLDALTLSETEVQEGLSLAVRDGKVIPVLCGSAEKLIGIGALLDDIIRTLPSPADRTEKDATGEAVIEARESAPLAALVFKTVVDQYGRVSFLRLYAGALQGDTHFFNQNVGKRERMGGLFALQGKEHVPMTRAVPGDIVGTVKLEATNTGHTLCTESKPLRLAPPAFPPAVAWLAVHPKSRADEDKLVTGLRRLIEEDCALQWYRNEATNETILAGLGEVHLQTGIERLKRKFGVEVVTTPPRIPYKETVRKRASFEGRHKKQTGGAGQYGVATIEIAPLPRGAGFQFEDAIVGGVIPNTYIPSVEKGVRERIERGFLAGYPMVDVQVKLTDGKTHAVDSNAISFQLAGRLAAEGAVPLADPYLLEPVMNIEIVVPEANMGVIIGDLNGKRGRIMGMEASGHYQVVRAQAPLAELSRYSAELRSITRGRGSFSMTISHFEEVPAHQAQKVIAEARARKEEEK